jgi:hypothetical protein
MTSRTVTVSLLEDDGITAIPVPFDPKVAFGKVRAPVSVTINGYTFRSTIARMGGVALIPFRKSHREAAGIGGGGRVIVTIAADTESREVEVPADLQRALKANAGVWKKWQALSYTHQREWVESVIDAKKPETRARRIAKAAKHLRA